MIINRVIIDTLDWLRDLFWHDNKLPYTVLKVEDYPTYQLKELKRDTKRSVISYIYTPKPFNGRTKVKSPSHEYYICLDHLGLLYKKGNDRFEGATNNTHSFSIIKTKRWVKRTSIEATVIEYVELNLRPKNKNKTIEEFAIEVVKESLKQLQYEEIHKIKWPYVLNHVKVNLNSIVN